MRYLKTYKIFESLSKFSEYMINDIKDILLELSDEGIEFSNIKEVNYNPPLLSGTIKSLNIDIYSYSFFTWDDIKDAILRLEEYLWRFEQGYRFDVEVSRNDDWMSLDRFIDVYSEEEFTKPGISLLIYSEEDYNKLEQDADDLLESKKESMVDKKIQLLEELALELKDIGLTIEIWKENDSIVMLIADDNDNSNLTDDNYYNSNLTDFKIISDFELTLKSFGMNYRKKYGSGDKVYYKFDKFGKKTDSSYLKIKL